MAKRMGPEERECECGAKMDPYDTQEKCFSCRYHDGEPEAVEAASAEIIADQETASEKCSCGEMLDKDCWGMPRCPTCDPPCPGCDDGGGPSWVEDDRVEMETPW